MSSQNVNDIIKFRSQKYLDLGCPGYVRCEQGLKGQCALCLGKCMLQRITLLKDLSGFQFVSFHKITSVYSIVRNWTSPRIHN